MFDAKPKGIQLNRNAVNILQQYNNHQQQQPQLLKVTSDQPLKPTLLQPQQQPLKQQQVDQNNDNIAKPPFLKQQPLTQKQQDAATDENFGLCPLKQSPGMPSQPKFKSLNSNVVPNIPAAQETSRIPKLSIKLPLKTLNINNVLKEKAAEEKVVVELQQQEVLKPVVVVDNKPEEQEDIEDIDKSTSRDAIFLVCDIAKDIYDYMFQLEDAQSVRDDYLNEQKIFTPKVRSRLVNWCIETHQQLRLLPETLYMTIAVIDRFFDKVPVKQQSQVQLVAVGAILIASKYEEIYPPDVGDLLHLTQNSYSRRDIMRIEICILEQLEFNLGKPIPLAFLRRFSKAAHCDLKMHSIAKYLMELCLAEYECASWRPSLLAAAALFATIHLVTAESALSSSSTSSTFSAIRRPFGLQQNQQHLQQSPQDRWNKALVHYTSYSRKDLQKPAGIICKALKNSQKNPQLYACTKKNISNLAKWPELKSTRVDELIRLGDRI